MSCSILVKSGKILKMALQQRNSLQDFVALRNIKDQQDTNELRERRSEQNLQQRKRRRDREIDKHRNVDDSFDNLIEDVLMLDVNNNAVESYLKKEWIEAVFSDQIFKQLDAVLKLSTLLLRNNSSEVIQEIIKAGMVPRLFELLQCRANRDIPVGLPHPYVALS